MGNIFKNLTSTPHDNAEEIALGNGFLSELINLFKPDIGNAFTLAEERHKVFIGEYITVEYVYDEIPLTGTPYPTAILGLAGIVLKKDCKTASPRLIALVCQTIASELNTMFRYNEIPLFAYVIVVDPKLD
jgi:hypothetical protein